MERLTAEKFLELIAPPSSLEEAVVTGPIMDFIRLEPKISFLANDATEEKIYYGPNPVELGYVGNMNFLSRIDQICGTTFVRDYLNDRLRS